MSIRWRDYPAYTALLESGWYQRHLDDLGTRLGPRLRRTPTGFEPVNAWASSKLPDHMQEKAAVKAREAAERAQEALRQEQAKAQATLARKAAMITDESVLVTLAGVAIGALPEIADKVRSGKTSAANALVGSAMKASGGKGDPARLRELILERLAQEPELTEDELRAARKKLREEVEAKCRKPKEGT